MHRMVGFIQKNYSAKISLNDIAYAGMVCKSGCCELFKLYVHKTPFNYLNEYRISKGKDLLDNSELNMAEIAAACGFESSSYFADLFHRQYGCSPRQYRNQRKTKG